MKKTLIVRIGEGLGNQLFMYANAYSLSKKFDWGSIKIVQFLPFCLITSGFDLDKLFNNASSACIEVLFLFEPEPVALDVSFLSSEFAPFKTIRFYSTMERCTRERPVLALLLECHGWLVGWLYIFIIDKKIQFFLKIFLSKKNGR